MASRSLFVALTQSAWWRDDCETIYSILTTLKRNQLLIIIIIIIIITIYTQAFASYITKIPHAFAVGNKGEMRWDRMYHCKNVWKEVSNNKKRSIGIQLIFSAASISVIVPQQQQQQPNLFPIGQIHGEFMMMRHLAAYWLKLVKG